MKTIPALCIGLLVGSIGFESLSLLRAEPPHVAAPAAQVGRYQLSHQQGAVWFLDTATGDAWYRDTSGKWTGAGNPVADRK